MKLLFDTHAWFWWLQGSSRLSEAARDALNDAGNERHLSPISSWELMVLDRKGRLDLEPTASEFISDALRQTPALTIAVSNAIAIRSEMLDGFRTADPADRFLVATALEHDLVIVTADQPMHDYEPVHTLW